MSLGQNNDPSIVFLYDLTLFVGFKVAQMVSVLNKAETIEKPVNTIVEDFQFVQTVSTGTSPSHILLSADDLTLAVCIKKDDTPFALMYDVRAFAAGVSTILVSSLSALVIRYQ